jgi:CDP-paratose 2-epimerase
VSHDADKLIRQLSLVAYIMAEKRPITARDAKNAVEGYYDMSDEAFARRFYADRAELLALEYGDAFGFPVWINRCGVLAGRGQFGKADQGIFSFWIRSWRENRPLKYIGFGGTGAQVRDCLHPKDLVTVLKKQMETDRLRLRLRLRDDESVDLRICNFGGGVGNSCSLRQLSEWCEKRFGPRKVESDPKPRPYDLPWVVMDSSRAEKMWGWKVQTTMEQIFEEIADS